MKRRFTVRQGALDGVEAFLGVALHHSFRKAGDELGVTTSAVSQAIRADRSFHANPMPRHWGFHLKGHRDNAQDHLKITMAMYHEMGMKDWLAVAAAGKLE
jgi:hypothetical protein